jgi:hypothetical protein
MRRLDFSRFGFITVVSVLSLGFASGCGGGDDDPATGGTGGTGSGGTGGSGGASADLIPWDMDGWVAADANTYEIQGPWYSYNDCDDAMPLGLPCTQPEMSMMGPDDKLGWTTSPEKVCTKGVSPQVIMYQGMLAYSQQWGAGIALDLNSTGGDMAVKNDYDAAAKGIKGFMFDIISNTTPATPAEVRVNFKTKLTGDASHFVPTAPKANVQVLFADAMQGSWITDPMMIKDLPVNALESVQFQVATNKDTPSPFDFCVSNMRVIK